MDHIARPVLEAAGFDTLALAIRLCNEACDDDAGASAVAELLRRQLDADRAAVFLPADNGGAERVHVVCHRGDTPPVSAAAPPSEYPDVMNLPLAQVIREGTPWLDGEPAAPHRVCLPLKGRGRVVGALLVERQDGFAAGVSGDPTTAALAAQLATCIDRASALPALVTAAASSDVPLDEVPAEAFSGAACHDTAGDDLFQRQVLVWDDTGVDPGRPRERRFLAALIDAIPLIIVIKDLDRRWVLVNRATCEWYGKSAAELIGRTDAQLHPREVAARYYEEDERAVRSADPVIVEEQRIDRDGRVRWFLKTKYGFRLPDGRAFCASLGADITDRKIAEQETAQARRFLDALINGIPETLFVKNRQHRFVLANDRFCALMGLPRERLLGASDDAVFTPEIAHGYWDEDDAAFSATGPLVVEETNRDADGHDLWYLKTKCAIRLPDGNDYVVGTHIDITRLKLAELALRRSESRFRGTFEQAAVGLCHSAPDGRFLRINRRFCEIVGYSTPEMLRFTFSDITHPDDLPADLDNVRALLAGEVDTYALEKRYLRSDGTHVWVNLTVSLATAEDGTPDYFIGVVEEITGRKLAEERVQAALHEKETLLKEIHHRVKNNLQVVTSLLQMQGRELGEDRFTAAIDDSVRRVQSMALVHEQLYRSKDLARVDFGDYMQTLVEQLSHATHAQARGIRVEADVLQAPMGIETAIPCGLIVSELVSNAFKHAFTGRDRGTVMVRFRAGPAARHWVLTVADDGVGLPADIDVHRSRSLGLRLIATLTEQLSGTLDIARGQGTAFTVTFLDEDKAK
ncbi:MAG: PAS domain S-box protein [Burkholderiales bacterium]